LAHQSIPLTGTSQVEPAFVMPGGFDGERLADAVLRLPAFAAAERPAVRGIGIAGGHAAVVTRKADDRVAAEALFFERIQNDSPRIARACGTTLTAAKGVADSETTPVPLVRVTRTQS